MNILDKIRKSTAKKVNNAKQKTMNEIVMEIHEDFMTEVDRLLKEAQISKSVETNKQDLIDKSNRLKKLGFYNTAEIIEADKEIRRLYEIEKENLLKADLISAISYFSYKYPKYKFITEDSVKKICNKYGLIYGDVQKYKGTVPDSNLKQIENFKIEEKDQCYFCETRTIYNWSSDKKIEFISLDAYKKGISGNSYRVNDSYTRYSYDKCNLDIAAPINDFVISGMEVSDFELKEKKIEIPDPVVLQPVFFKDKKYYLIVTAWGLEAEDPLIKNS